MTLSRPTHGALYLLSLGLLACDAGPAESLKPAPSRPAVLFHEVTSELGLPGEREAWPDGTYSLPEIMGGGVGLFDLDGDGDLDIVQVRSPPPGSPTAPAPNRLYRQEADGTFRDVSESSGLADPGHGQGVAIGDVDGDGDLDVFFTNHGRDALYRNLGDGTFVDATAEAGFIRMDWSTSAAFVDHDRDGDLDLYVVNYVAHDPKIPCRLRNGAREYCGPEVFPPTLDALYRNDGSGVFEDVSSEAGIDVPGAGLGIAATDLTGDGWPDLLVANDGMVNHFWVNQRDGTFVEDAVMRGLGFNAAGQPESSMGLAVGDIDGNHVTDVLMTHLADQTNTLYTGSESGLFTDDSAAAGLSAVDLQYTGFGCAFLDFDHDGDLDLAVVNGRVDRDLGLSLSEVGFWGLYAERNLLFRNRGDGHFDDVSSLAGAFGSTRDVSRGLAFGDLDSDGDLDLVVGNLGGIRVYRNDAADKKAHWLQVRCMTGRRDAIGARVTLIVGGVRHDGLVLPASSYLSSSDPRVHFGLGSATRVDRLEVAWPNGRVETFPVAIVDREMAVTQGTGSAR